MEITNVQDAVRDIKNHEQNALRARMGQRHTKSFTFLHPDERPVIAGYWCDGEPQDLVVHSVIINAHDEILIACYPKDMSVVNERYILAGEFFAGHLDYVTSNIK